MRERNHQGLDNRRIRGAPEINGGTGIRRRPRLGGMLHAQTEEEALGFWKSLDTPTRDGAN